MSWSSKPVAQGWGPGIVKGLDPGPIRSIVAGDGWVADVLLEIASEGWDWVHGGLLHSSKPVA